MRDLMGHFSGVRIIRGAFSPRFISNLTGICDETWVAAQKDGPSKNFLTQVGSVRLRPYVRPAALFSLAQSCAHVLGRVQPQWKLETWYCNMDQAWLRRQYAPCNQPPNHYPHSWHQDGALYFDFMGRPPKNKDLLSMITCWLPLTPCGSKAPGLELAEPSPQKLLSPPELFHEAVYKRTRQFQRPELEPGDLLVFDGAVLHRTHLTQDMTADRTSVEFRFVPSPTARLDNDLLKPVN